MLTILKWLLSLAAAVGGGIVGDILYAQRSEHPNGDIVPALMPTQVMPCLGVVILASRVTKGNPLAMIGAGLAAGVVSSLTYGSAAKEAMMREIEGE